VRVISAAKSGARAQSKTNTELLPRNPQRPCCETTNSGA